MINWLRDHLRSLWIGVRPTRPSQPVRHPRGTRRARRGAFRVQYQRGGDGSRQTQIGGDAE